MGTESEPERINWRINNKNELLEVIPMKEFVSHLI
jgi:hypothetical protein